MRMNQYRSFDTLAHYLHGQKVSVATCCMIESSDIYSCRIKFIVIHLIMGGTLF